MLAGSVMLGAPALTIPDLKVGKHLQTCAGVRLTETVPNQGLQITVTSGDPKRLLLSLTPDNAGSASVVLAVKPGVFQSPDFCVQGLADSGSVAYTAIAAGAGTAKGTVTLVPSAIAIAGPFNLPSFPSTPRGEAKKITIASVTLDPALKLAQEQPIAGGLRAEVNITNSNPEIGVLQHSKLILDSGSSSAITYFQAAAHGKTVLTVTQPPGFTTPAEFAAVTAMIDRPGLGIVDDVTVGKDLQIPGVLCLGEPAPPGGLKVTITSSDASKLLLSIRQDEPGSGAITITVPEGQLVAKYALHGLADSGEVTYRATAPGFRSRIAKVTLAPSGVIVAYERYGPPDEADVVRKGGAGDDRRFYASLADSKQRPVSVVVWTVYLLEGRAADITVQQLRPGVSPAVL